MSTRVFESWIIQQQQLQQLLSNMHIPLRKAFNNLRVPDNVLKNTKNRLKSIYEVRSENLSSFFKQKNDGK